MPVTLAKGEKIIKSYDYGKVKGSSVLDATASSGNLTVTNRRIIHSRNIKGMGKGGISVEEIPVSSAKYVNVAYRTIRYPVFLVVAIILMLLSVMQLASEDDSTATALVFGIVAVVCFVLYLVKKDCELTCAIATTGIVSPVMLLSTSSGNSFTRRLYRKARAAASATTFSISVKVNEDVAKQMSEELGAIILETANGEEND